MSSYAAPSISSWISSNSSRISSKSRVSNTSRSSIGGAKLTDQSDPNDDVYPTTPEAPARLARARVLYLGTAATNPALKGQGLGLVARPVTERLPADLKEVQAIDAWLFVLDNGVQIGYVTDAKFLVWIPMQNVHMVAAIKRKEIGNPSLFVPIDSPDAIDAHSPPIFTLVTQRSNGLMECHSFICTSDPATMSLVKACTYAHNRKEAWTRFPPSRNILLMNLQETHDDLDDRSFSIHDVEAVSESDFSSVSTQLPLEETGTEVDIPEGFYLGGEDDEQPYRRARRRGSPVSSRTSRSSRSTEFRSMGDYRTAHSRNTYRTADTGSWHTSRHGSRHSRRSPEFDVEVLRPVGRVPDHAPMLSPWAVPQGRTMAPQPIYHPVPVNTPAPLVVYGGSANAPYSAYSGPTTGYSYRSNRSRYSHF